MSYLTGWIMLLAYFIVCPWEAVAVGKLAAYIFPRLDTLELYRIAGQPVFLPRLLLGYLLTVFLALPELSRHPGQRHCFKAGPPRRFCWCFLCL